MGVRFTQPDLILLDLDGTISDPVVGFARSINYALSHFGYPEMPPETLAQHVGPPLDNTLRAVSGETSPDRINELVVKYRERYADIGYSENIVYPGIADALAFLSAANIPLAICTSKRADFAERILEMFGLRDHFEFVSGGDVGIEKTQQIEGLVRDGVAGETSIMIGDRDVDMIAAHRNGLRSAGVLWGFGSREELEGEAPDVIFETPNELCGLAEACPTFPIS